MLEIVSGRDHHNGSQFLRDSKAGPAIEVLGSDGPKRLQTPGSKQDTLQRIIRIDYLSKGHQNPISLQH